MELIVATLLFIHLKQISLKISNKCIFIENLTIDEIKRLMNYMCFFKLNRFHWHLTDNEAWRVELDCYPNLTKVGAFRGYDHKIPPFYGAGYNKTGGYYSRSQIKELTEYGKQRNIEIMPEIDLPAHSLSLIHI